MKTLQLTFRLLFFMGTAMETWEMFLYVGVSENNFASTNYSRNAFAVKHRFLCTFHL
jgi:hypothetical protein